MRHQFSTAPRVTGWPPVFVIIVFTRQFVPEIYKSSQWEWQVTSLIWESCLAGNSDRNYSGHRPAWMAAVWTCQMSDWTNTSHSDLAHHVSHPPHTFHNPHSTTTQDTFHTHPLRWNSCVVRRWRFCKQVSKYNFKASYHCLNGSAHC